MKKLTILLGAAMVLGLAAIVSGTVLRVPSEYPTIQAGIDAALEGDTVLVADGIYAGEGNRDLDFGGVNMVVMSENGPEVTIIDCELLGRGFYFHSGEDSTSVVQGLTIKKGYLGDGGGIHCANSSPTIVGNTITENTAIYDGGGIYCYESSPTIMGNTISANTADPFGGADGGGGIYCRYSPAVIVGNTITGNAASGLPRAHGGGITCAASDGIIRDNTISENYATYCAGGVYGYGGCSPLIEDNTISRNVCDGGAGGIAVYHACHATIRGNTITDNVAGYNGAIYCGLDSNPMIDANTIAWNMGGSIAGGIRVSQGSHPTVLNSIFWGDSAGTGPEIYLQLTSYITVSYSDVEGGSSAVYVEPGCALYWGEGNIDADPMVVFAEKGDYRLLWESPCIDAGDPTLWDPDLTRSDMGAHFFDQDDYMTLYLTPDTTEVSPGGELGVTYTAINRWSQPEPFWVLTEAVLPGGGTVSIMGPDQHTLPADLTVQRHLTHDVPAGAPPGVYKYESMIGVPPSTLYDEDDFEFRVIEP